MKKIFTLLFVVISVSAFAGSFKSNVHLGYGFKPVSETPFVKRSVMFKSFDYQKSYERDERCGRYRGLGIAGVVVLGCGIAGTVGGILMIKKGYNQLNDPDLGTVGLLYGGYVITILGVAMTAGGTVMTAIGFHKMRQYCRDDEEGFYLINRPNTVGLAYRF